MITLSPVRWLHISFGLLLLSMAVFSCGGERDDGINRSQDGVLLEPGEKFDESRRRER